jgi:hypothetical protein
MGYLRCTFRTVLEYIYFEQNFNPPVGQSVYKIVNNLCGDSPTAEASVLFVEADLQAFSKHLGRKSGFRSESRFCLTEQCSE